MKLKTPKKPALKKKKPVERSTSLSAALKESELRYRRLFEAAQDGILILDATTGRITDVNPFLLKLLGRTRDKFLGRKLWEIGLFQDVERSRSAFRELQRNGYIRYEDLPLETKDGRYIDVEFVSNVYMADGIKVIQCNIRDITDRKHADVEKAILQTVEEEQRRIGQDLHDGLCQQLTGVALIAKALAQKLSVGFPNESVDASEIADLISRSIDQTRDLARGLSPVEIETEGLPVALQKLADSVERLYHISCVFKFDKLMRFRYPYRPLLTTHLYRITQEAVNNATQHGKAKHVVITLETTQNRGTLTVQDDGLGLSADFNEKPGLGLRSMRFRARIISAQLKVSQGVGGGTIVNCSFPHEKKGGGSFQIMKVLNKKKAMTKFKRFNVFLVDDHPIVCRGLAQLINQEKDLIVSGEADGIQMTLERMKIKTPDVVLVDLSLNDENGLDLIKDIKVRFPKVAILAVSMHDEAFYAERVLRAGAKGYIMKQQATNQVLVAIRRILAGEVYLSEFMSSKILRKVTGEKDHKSDSALDRLSDRELEVFRLIGTGLGTRQIADRLSRSVKTVETYREHIKLKLDLKDSSALVQTAIQWLQSNS